MSKLYIFLVKKKTLYFKNTSTLYQHFTSKTWTEQKVKFFKENILLSKQQPIVAKTLLMKDTCYNRLFMKIKKVSPVFSCPKKEHFRLQKFSEKKNHHQLSNLALRQQKLLKHFTLPSNFFQTRNSICWWHLWKGYVSQ